VSENNSAWIGIVGVVIGALLGFFLAMGRDYIIKLNRKRQHKKMLIKELDELKRLYSSKAPFDDMRVGKRPISNGMKILFTRTFTYDTLEPLLLEEMDPKTMDALGRVKQYVYLWKEQHQSIDDPFYRSIVVEAIDNALFLLKN